MPIIANWDHNYNNDCIPNFSTNMNLPRHRWYEFKEGFGSSLVERAIIETQRISKNAQLTILDPFSGSGTTPLTALKNNCNAIGLEINPFMSFVGKTKCIMKIKKDYEYLEDLKWIMNQIPLEVESKIESKSTFTSGNEKAKWLFNLNVLRGFEALYQYISKIKNNDIFHLALYSAVMQCCNAKKDGKCLRYKNNWKDLDFSLEQLRSTFYQNSLDIISDIIAMPLYSGERIFFEGDSRKTIEKIESNSVDLTVFSPPYLNSFDYSDIYRPELFLGRYVVDNNELRDIRKNTLRSHVQYSWNTNDKSHSIWAQNIVNQVSMNKDVLWDKKIPQMIDAYFYDMEKILNELYRVSINGAQLWFVVGTSAYAGIEVPVDLILADIAAKQGWRLLNVNALRKLRTSSQCVDKDNQKIKLRESLVICQK